MQTRLYILMPSCRPKNIPAIAPSILQCDPHAFALRWIILQQAEEKDGKGMLKINEALDMIKDSDSFIHTPSDDTCHHPSLYRRAGEIIASNPSVKAIVFSEERGPKEEGRVLRAAPENMKPGMVDGSQYILNRAFIGDKRFDWEGRGQDADGCFIQELHEAHPESFFFCPEVLVRFNLLQWV